MPAESIEMETMIDEKTKAEILRSISYSGSVLSKINPIIGSDESVIVNLSSGKPRIRKEFNFISSQPQRLDGFSNLEIRCVLCKKVITYPAWYHVIEYAVNHFHFFVCFDTSSPEHVNAKCYRRG